MNRLLRDYTALIWLLVALAIALVAGVRDSALPASTWLIVHLLFLGALTHSALVWSEHFAQTLLKPRPEQHGERRQNLRMVALAVAGLTVVLGYPLGVWPLVVAGVVGVWLVLGAHALWLLRQIRRALPTRWIVVVHYYVAAALMLPVGGVFGAILAFGVDDEWRGRLLIAHMACNILGWIGLTVIGTLVTFWPTVVRAQMHPHAATRAAQALPVFVSAVLLTAVGAAFGQRWIVALGLAAYLFAAMWQLPAIVVPVQAKGLRDFASAAVGAALAWGFAGLLWLLVLVLGADSWTAITDSLPQFGLLAALGFGVQILFGALSYLIPTLVRGGPRVLRVMREEFNRFATFRLVIVNLALTVLALFLLVPWRPRILGAPVVWTLFAAVALGHALFLPLLTRGVLRGVRLKREIANPGFPAASTAPASAPLGAPTTATRAAKLDATAIEAALAAAERGFWNARASRASALALALVVGAAMAAPSFGIGESQLNTWGKLAPATSASADESASAAIVTPTGQTTRVTVRALDGMRFSPSSVTVPAGNRLEITLLNADSKSGHDLVLGDLATKRLQPGESQVLDVGVVGTDLEGYCSVAGHREMGMVFSVLVDGAPTTTDSSSTPAADSGHAQVTDSGSSHSTADAQAQLASSVPAVLPPLTTSAGAVHDVTLTVTETDLEVAPGVYQTRWTYNGQGVGPVLHGRVGDTFRVTLRNDGSIGHSIDFHAGALAPDHPMRTIAPGEELVYNFTASRAGVWMYHCSTMPMATHIAAGMHGAVVIEPEGLAAVDAEYLVVQSEVYLADGSGSSANTAKEVDAAKIAAGTPTYTVFNGVANQYVQHPLEVRAGSRVRFWVLDAGPNVPLSFHIVGTQFDTVWTEGAYTLRRGQGDGGAQVLPLLPAQGGFVELTFPEPGNYAVVNHIMSEAERGARGLVHVTD